MAFEPSKSKDKGKGRGLEKPSEPDMLPIMNLMVVLIPVLLSAAEMVKIRTLVVNLPVAGGGGNSSEDVQPDEPKEESQKLELTVTITKKGFFIGRKTGFISDFFPDMKQEGAGVQKGPDGKEIRNPDIMAAYSKEQGFAPEIYAKVNSSLVRLKKLIAEKNLDFTDGDRITIAAEKDIDYQTIIYTIDAVREYRNEKKEDLDLFPAVELGAY